MFVCVWVAWLQRYAKKNIKKKSLRDAKRAKGKCKVMLLEKEQKGKESKCFKSLARSCLLKDDFQAFVRNCYSMGQAGDPKNGHI